MFRVSWGIFWGKGLVFFFVRFYLGLVICYLVFGWDGSLVFILGCCVFFFLGVGLFYGRDFGVRLVFWCWFTFIMCG